MLDLQEVISSRIWEKELEGERSYKNDFFRKEVSVANERLGESDGRMAR